MSAFWTMAVFGIAIAAVTLVTFWRRSGRPNGLGVVSDQWIAEHQSGSGRDSSR